MLIVCVFKFKLYYPESIGKINVRIRSLSFTTRKASHLLVYQDSAYIYFYICMYMYFNFFAAVQFTDIATLTWGHAGGFVWWCYSDLYWWSDTCLVLSGSNGAWWSNRRDGVRGQEGKSDGMYSIKIIQLNCMNITITYFFQRQTLKKELVANCTCLPFYLRNSTYTINLTLIILSFLFTEGFWWSSRKNRFPRITGEAPKHHSTFTFYVRCGVFCYYVLKEPLLWTSKVEI